MEILMSLKQIPSIANIKKAAAGVLKSYPVISAYVFGSITKKANFPADIDIAIYLKPQSGLSLREELRLGIELEKRSGLSPIDLRILNEASLSFQGEVLKSGILIFSSDEKARVSYEVKVYRRYFDYLYYLKRLQDSFLHSVAERGII